MSNKTPNRIRIINILKPIIGQMRGMLNHDSKSRMISKDQFPKHFYERVKVTWMLARATHYLPFISNERSVDISVRGAVYQDRSCRGGDVTTVGLQASHVRLGSYFINGESSAQCWNRKFMNVREQKGFNTVEALKNLNGLAHFTGLCLLFEGRTHPEDALINQVFGTIETKLHPTLTSLNHKKIPGKMDELERQMISFSKTFIEEIPKKLLLITKEMAQKIKNDPKQDKTQKDWIIKPGSGFKSQSELLDMVISELDNSNSNTNRELNQLSTNISNSIAFDMTLVALAKEDAQ